MKDFYAIMGLQRNASQHQVRVKYLFLAKELHPDKPTGNERAFKELQEAYAILGDPAKRKSYDLYFNFRQFVPQTETDGAIDLIVMLRQVAAASRVPQQFVDQFSPVLERKLEERGVKARAVTAEDALEALGWLKPKRKKRAS